MSKMENSLLETPLCLLVLGCCVLFFPLSCHLWIWVWGRGTLKPLSSQTSGVWTLFCTFVALKTGWGCCLQTTCPNSSWAKTCDVVGARITAGLLSHKRENMYTWGSVFVVVCFLNLWRHRLEEKVLNTLFLCFVMPVLLYKVNNLNYPIKFQRCTLIVMEIFNVCSKAAIPEP